MSAFDRGQSKLSEFAFLVGYRPRAARSNSTEARSAAKAGLALNPAFTISQARATWTAMSDDPTYLAQLEPIFEGLHKAEVPEE